MSYFYSGDTYQTGGYAKTGTTYFLSSRVVWDFVDGIGYRARRIDSSGVADDGFFLWRVNPDGVYYSTPKHAVRPVVRVLKDNLL